METVMSKPETQSTAEAQASVCRDIQIIMATYREQMASDRGLGTPGGLEHMGDVWQQLAEWDAPCHEQIHDRDDRRHLR